MTKEEKKAVKDILDGLKRFHEKEKEQTMKFKFTKVFPTMTVFEYRQKNPDCEYCVHQQRPFDTCLATNKRMGKTTAKKCPCYIPETWKYEKGGRTDA